MTQTIETPRPTQGRACINRRDFLILGGASLTVMATFGQGAYAQDLVTSAYSHKVIGKLSELEPGVPIP
ncbi:MAG: hypothetical protein ACE10M_03280, partial [Alphaproteobacteria bacterium]